MKGYKNITLPKPKTLPNNKEYRHGGFWKEKQAADKGKAVRMTTFVKGGTFS